MRYGVHKTKAFCEILFRTSRITSEAWSPIIGQLFEGLGITLPLPPFTLFSSQAYTNKVNDYHQSLFMIEHGGTLPKAFNAVDGRIDSMTTTAVFSYHELILIEK